MSVRIDPTNRYLYVCNQGSGTVSAYSIGADGNLTSQGTAATGSKPTTMAFDPDGKFLYVYNDGNDENIAVYRIGAGGSLTEITTAATRIHTDGRAASSYYYTDAMVSVKVE